jgi:hypothetical protein
MMSKNTLEASVTRVTFGKTLEGTITEAAVIFHKDMATGYCPSAEFLVPVSSDGQKSIEDLKKEAIKNAILIANEISAL